MSHLHAVPDLPDIYGWVPFLADSSKPPIKLSVGVQYGENDDPGTDIVLDPNGWLLKHRYDTERQFSTEEERAAVHWTW